MGFEFPAWDPVLIPLPGPFDVRWYGLMYLAAFAVGYKMLGWMAGIGFLPMKREQIGDLLFWLVIGVLVGGRLGWILFYGDSWLDDPLRIFEIWEGGLAFHGGLLGVAVVGITWARKHGVPVLRLGDAAAIATCPGILFVRLANFVNGELYGRVTSPETFGAMRFPTDPAAERALGLAPYALSMRDRELAVQVAYGHRSWEETADELSAVDRAGREIPWEEIRPRLDWDAAKEQVPFRHASQLYEGFAEGLLLGIVLLVLLLATRRRPWGRGRYFAVFLLGYATARILLENVRQPDRQFTGPDDPVGYAAFGLTMGQILSIAMLVAGVLLLVFAPKAGERDEAGHGDVTAAGAGAGEGDSG